MDFGYWVVREKTSKRFIGEVGLSEFRREIVPSFEGTAEAGWINSGVYWFEHSLLAALRPDQSLSLERDVFGAWRGAGLYGFQQPGRFLDIGIPEDYARAERFLAEVAASTPALAI